MAERRMFAKAIVTSDAFLDMPSSARLLYYDLGMRADDDGFVNSPRRVMRETGASEDDMTILLAKGFLYKFDSGVVVIKHWRVNNYLQKDRHKPTTYQDELKRLFVKENRVYSLKDASVYGVYTQNSLDKNRLIKGAPAQSFPQSECGKPSPNLPQLIDATIDAALTAALCKDKYCTNCGHQMVMRNDHAVCPECSNTEWEVRHED